MTRHVILGAGPAGINAIETIRALEPDAPVSLVCDEPAYARMVLPYYLAETIQEGTLFTGDAAWLEQQKVEAHIGRRASGVDPAAKRVTLDDGSTLDYDALLIATGSRAARPPLPGLEGDGVVDMWTLADANALRAASGVDVVVVGAGFIGLIILDALVRRGCRVRFIEIAPHILPRMLDPVSAALVAAHLREAGVELLTDCALESVERRGGRLHLQLAGGNSLECDQLVMATGIRANTEFLEGSGIARETGVVVNDQLESGTPGIYAAGDVAQGPDLLAGGTAVHAIQPTAIDHGRVAGANMAGLGVPYSGSLAMNVLHTQDLESCSFGMWQGDGRECTVVENPGDRIYRKYVWDGDRMVGGALVGPTAAVSGTNDAGMLKGLIQSGVALGPWRAHLEENPLDLRRAFVASGATQKLLGTTLLTGRPSTGGGYRFPPLPPLRKRSPHHPVLTTGFRR